MKTSPSNKQRGSGGTEGGIGMFFLGFALAGVALYFFFDSVRVDTRGYGWLSGAMGGGGRGGGGMAGLRETTSMGILFLPFLLLPLPPPLQLILLVRVPLLLLTI